MAVGLDFRWGIVTDLCILIIGGRLGSPGSAADIWDAIKVSGNRETLITNDDIKIRCTQLIQSSYILVWNFPKLVKGHKSWS